MTKKAFNPQQIAAMAAGITLAAATEVVDPAIAAALAATEATAAAALVAAAATAATAALSAEAATVVDPKIVASAEPAAGDTILAYLKDQVKDKDTALVAAQVEITSLKANVADMQANFDGLLAIAGKSLSNMQVALGGSAVKVEGMSATAVLAEHARVSATFQDKFKAGGVAAVDAADASNDVKPVSDALAQARIAAVRRPTAKTK